MRPNELGKLMRSAVLENLSQIFKIAISFSKKTQQIQKEERTETPERKKRGREGKDFFQSPLNLPKILSSFFPIIFGNHMFMISNFAFIYGSSISSF